MYFKFTDSGVFFPSNPLRNAKFNEFDMPSDSKIEETVSTALAMAVDDAKKFRIDVSQDDIKNCLLDFTPSLGEQEEQDPDDAFVDLGIGHVD